MNSKALTEIGGPLGLVRAFGRLLPDSLMAGNPAQSLLPAQWSEVAHCAELGDEQIHAAWHVIRGVLSQTYLASFEGMTVRLPPKLPASKWCDQAPPWIRYGLQKLEVGADPSRLIDLPLLQIHERLLLKPAELLIFLLYIEAAWKGHSLTFPDPLLAPLRRRDIETIRRDKRESLVPFIPIAGLDWPLQELPDRARQVLALTRGDLPLPDDLRFRSRLAAVLGAGRSMTNVLLPDMTAPPDFLSNQAMLVDGLQRALAMTAKQELEDIGAFASLESCTSNTITRGRAIWNQRFGSNPQGNATFRGIAAHHGLSSHFVERNIDGFVQAIESGSLWIPSIRVAYADCMREALKRSAGPKAERDITHLSWGGMTAKALQRFQRAVGKAQLPEMDLTRLRAKD